METLKMTVIEKRIEKILRCKSGKLALASEEKRYITTFKMSGEVILESYNEEIWKKVNIKDVVDANVIMLKSKSLNGYILQILSIQTPVKKAPV